MTPDNQIIESKLDKMTKVIVNGDYPNIHSVLISLKGEIVYEKYFNGTDELYGKDLGAVEITNDYLHDVRSIAKNIVSACVGIAINQGKITSINQNIFDFFPSHQNLKTGLRAKLTIKHLLTMTSGMVWNEPVPFTDPTNSEILMINSPDPIDYVLKTPLDIEPGKEWRYNGGNTQLLAAIIEKTCDQSIDNFAKKYIFDPLGITKHEWINCPGSNVPAAASGLRLTTQDLLKFGQLYLNHGHWQSKQIIPKQWVIDSMKSHIQRSDTEGYGYAFWLWSDTVDGKETSFTAAVGNGDQRIYLDSSNELVVVVTAGNYDQWDIVNNSYELLKQYILPAI